MADEKVMMVDGKVKSIKDIIEEIKKKTQDKARRLFGEG